MEEIYIEFGEVGAPSIYEITKMIFDGGQQFSIFIRIFITNEKIKKIKL